MQMLSDPPPPTHALWGGDGCLSGRNVKFPQDRSTRPRVQGLLGHQIDENGEAHFFAHTFGEDEFCAEHLPVRGFLSPETLQLIEYCRDNKLMEQLGIFGNA